MRILLNLLNKTQYSARDVSCVYPLFNDERYETTASTPATYVKGDTSKERYLARIADKNISSNYNPKV